MQTADYNGWPNRATWNTHLWLTGVDEELYHVARGIARRFSAVEYAAWAIEDLCRDIWGDETPDGQDLDLVDWSPIAAALREP